MAKLTITHYTVKPSDGPIFYSIWVEGVPGKAFHLPYADSTFQLDEQVHRVEELLVGLGYEVAIIDGDTEEAA